jgi:hypothetical protein
MGLLRVQLKRVLGELEKFLDESSELADAAPLLGQDLLGCTERASLRTEAEITQDGYCSGSVGEWMS